MNNNLISRSAVKDIAAKYGATDDFDMLIDQIPAVDAEPVRHGRWEWYEEWIPSTTDHCAECIDCGWRCSECKHVLEDMVGGCWYDPDEKPELNYCPNCGAKMNGDKDAAD